MVSKEIIAQIVQQAFVEQFCDDIDFDMPLASFGADSLDMMNVVVDVEHDVNERLDDPQIKRVDLMKEISELGDYKVVTPHMISDAVYEKLTCSSHYQ